MPYAVLTGIVDMAPIPVVVEYVKGYFRTAILRQIAKAYRLRVDKGVISVLTLGEISMGFSGIVHSTVKFLTSPWQHIKNFSHFTGLAEETARTYAMAFLFERYLEVTGVRHLEAKEALEIREAMDAAFFKSAQVVVAPFFLALRQFSPPALFYMVRASLRLVILWSRKRKMASAIIDRVDKQAGTFMFLSVAMATTLQMKEGTLKKTLECEFFAELVRMGLMPTRLRLVKTAAG